jgi:quercetin dioxygenase-like cupin family protein
MVTIIGLDAMKPEKNRAERCGLTCSFSPFTYHFSPSSPTQPIAFITLRLHLLFAICRLLFLVRVMSQPPIERKQLLKAVLKNGAFTSADVREIRLQAGQQSGRHLHPCAVLGYIVEGTATYQIEGEAEQILPAGSAFHEPAGAVIANFGNASDVEPMTFVAFYLLNGEQALIEMLESK